MSTAFGRPTSTFVRFGVAAAAGAALLLAVGAPAELVAVRHAEGVVHGFLALRALDGRTLADGDLIQSARGDRVTSRLVFHFRDGSLHDETVVFSPSGSFRLISDHLGPEGPGLRAGGRPLDRRRQRPGYGSLRG